MENKFPKHFEYQLMIRGTECDSRERLFPHELLSMAQEAADGHVRSHGYDNSSLQQRGLCWMISAISVFFPGKLPKWRDHLRIRTWCREIRGVRFRREHLFWEQEAEQPFAHLCSDWIVLTDEEHRPVSPFSFMSRADKEIFSSSQTYLGEKAARLTSLSSEEKMLTERSEERVRYREVDINRHFNNCCYLAACLDFIYRVLRSRGEILENLRLLRFDINFVAEIMENEPYDLLLLEDRGAAEELLPAGLFAEVKGELKVFRVEGEKKDGSQCFRARLCFMPPEKGESL